MPHPTHKSTAHRAKPDDETRPPSAMPRLAALAALALFATVAGCFEVQYSCRITCSGDQKCPSGMVCLMENGASAGLCATAETTSCSLSPGDDAGAGGLDGGSDGPNGTDGSSDADESLPPQMHLPPRKLSSAARGGSGEPGPAALAVEPPSRRFAGGLLATTSPAWKRRPPSLPHRPPAGRCERC